MEITGNQLRAARALRGWQQRDLAEAAGIGIATIERMEASGSEIIESRDTTIAKVIEALEASGVTFTGGELSLGVKMALKRRK